MLDNISVCFTVGSLHIIKGNSGSGKSTLFHIIAGLIPQSGGKVTYNTKKIGKEEVTLVLQTPHFFGDLSLGDNIALPLLYGKKGVNTDIRKYTFTFNISKVLKRKASVCSGGEKARANIVRGISENKRIVLIDEPTANLDEENAKLVAKELNKLAQKRIVIVSTHQAHFFRFGNSIHYLMIDGKLVKTE